MMELEESVNNVYALVNEKGIITHIDGGITEQYIRDLSKWTLIDSGEGVKYAFCQGNYLPTPLIDDRGIYRYKLVNGEPIERTQEEMDADWVEPPYIPSPEERIAGLEAATDDIILLMAELIGG